MATAYLQMPVHAGESRPVLPPYHIAPSPFAPQHGSQQAMYSGMPAPIVLMPAPAQPTQGKGKDHSDKPQADKHKAEKKHKSGKKQAKKAFKAVQGNQDWAIDQINQLNADSDNEDDQEDSATSEPDETTDGSQGVMGQLLQGVAGGDEQQQQGAFDQGTGAQMPQGLTDIDALGGDFMQGGCFPSFDRLMDLFKFGKKAHKKMAKHSKKH